MRMHQHVWVVILAAGDGQRLRALTTDEDGLAIPKQFCSIFSEASMLQLTLRRAQRVVPPERIVTVVAEQHRLWWEVDLAGCPAENIVVQPKNLGTAVGVLLPILHIFRQDPHAQVLVLPSDHYVEDEEIFHQAILHSIPAAEGRFNRLVLLGMKPDASDAEYGWIVPSEREDTVHGVASFVEKPPVWVAEELMAQGALWNSFVFVGAVSTFIRMYSKTLPEILQPFLTNGGDLHALYAMLPARDFSRDVLEKMAAHLWVLPVPLCGWSDLGTPHRIATVLARKGHYVSGNERGFLGFPKRHRHRSARQQDEGIALG